MKQSVSLVRLVVMIAVASLLASCVCLRHAIEKPEKHATPCGRDVLKPGDHLCKVTVGGDERTFLLHVPKGPPRSPRWTVIFGFHGVGSNAKQMAKVSELAELGDRERVLTVFPQGLGVVPAWNTAYVGTAKRSEADELAFFAEMLATLHAIAKIDEKRIYVAGFSNGGFLAHKLACEASGTIAAIGVVAAINGEAACAVTRPVPVIAFHGLRDPVVQYSGAEELGVPSVMRTMTDWAVRDGCAAGEPVVFEEKGEVTCREWPACQGGAEVILCTGKEGGHTWPGGGNPSYMGHTITDIDATERMWAFFEKHPLP